MPDLASIKPSERRIDIKYPNSEKKTGLDFGFNYLDDDRLKKLRRSYQDEANRAGYPTQQDHQRGRSDEKLTRLVIAAMTGWGSGKRRRWGRSRFQWRQA